MRPDDILAYTPSKQGLVIEAKHTRHFRVLGSSIPCSGTRDTDVSFASFTMNDQKEGLVAVVVNGRKDEDCGRFAFLLHVLTSDSLDSTRLRSGSRTHGLQRAIALTYWLEQICSSRPPLKHLQAVFFIHESWSSALRNRSRVSGWKDRTDRDWRE